MVRFKNRYLVSEYEITSASMSKIAKHQLMKLTEDQIEILYGDFGAAALRFGWDVKYFNANTKMVIFRARHGPHKLLSSAIPTMQSPVKMKVLRRTATIMKAFRFIRDYHMRNLEKRWKQKNSEL